MPKYRTANTWCSIYGEEHDVMVEYTVSPPEPDVNWPGDIEVNAVWCEECGNMVDEMTNAELAELIERLTEDEDDGGREDYEYERWKERKLERDDD